MPTATTRYRVTRDVPADHPHNFVGRDVKAGTIFIEHRGMHYGCVDYRNGVAVVGDDGQSFREFPRDAVEVVT